MAPIEEVLRDLIGMFRGSLPKHIVAAMTSIFNLDDDDVDVLDEALLQHAGTTVTELMIRKQLWRSSLSMYPSTYEPKCPTGCDLREDSTCIPVGIDLWASPACTLLF